MDIGMLMFITAIMSIVQISVWQLFSAKWRDILMANPVLAFIINLAGSGLIAAFTGVASIVGVCNMGASVVFGAYAWWYAKHRNIKGLGIGWYKAWGWLPLWPTILVQYEKDGESWYV